LANGYRLVATTQNYSGQILDWIAGDSVPGSDEPPPPPIDLSDLHLPPGVQLGKTELEMYPELQGPTDAIAIPRMMFSTYVNADTGAGSLEEFLEQSEPQSGLPGGKDRLYTGYKLHMFSMASVAMVNAFEGPLIDDKTFSLMEMAVGCMWKDDPSTLQLVGMAASRDNHNFTYWDDSWRLRLQVEYYTQGPETTGSVGGWYGSALVNNLDFVVKSPTTVAYPGAYLKASTVDGAQWEHRFEIHLYNGNWWLALNGEWFGYYPAWRLPLMQNYTCDLYWYTEVYDDTPADSTYTDAGSGEFADAGFGKAAYFRRIFYVDQWGESHWLLPDKAIPVPDQNPNCYTTGPLIVTNQVGYEYENRCYCGGPGFDPVIAPLCY
jgi:hypothetical protein